MFFSRLNKQEKYLLYASVTVLSLVFFDKVIFSPIMGVLNGLNKKISAHEKELKNSLLVLNKEEFITNNYSEKTGSLGKISSNEEEIADMSSTIERLARKTSVLIQNIKPLSVEEQDLYFKYKIEIEAEADMSKLIDFIYQLEKSPKLYRVKKLSLTSKKKDAKELKVSLLITKIAIP